jgi:choline dehydrogenase-like flavoprotein
MILGNASLSKFDVLIIGSGAGGGPVAYLLTKFGLKVLILEAGPNHFTGLDDPTQQPTSVFSNDELKLEHRNFISANANVDPRTWRTSPSDGDRTYVGGVQNLPKTVGGGALHADLKMPRFAPTDFQLGTLIGSQYPTANFADWPVTYDMLEPFYTFAEYALGVQGLAGANPFEGPRSKPFPMPPGVPMYLALKMAAGLKTLGYTAFPFPTAVNSQPYDGRPACVDCGFCSGYPCPTNAKGAPAVTMLRKALLSGNCQLQSETRVVKLVLNGAKNQITAVEALGPDGKQVTFTADRYVIAASPIEDARLLLLSDPDGVGNSSGMVGRNIMFHFQTGAVGLFEERLHGHRGRVVSHGFADFRGVPNDPAHPLAGIVEISGSEAPIDETSYIKQVFDVAGFDGAQLKALLRQSPFRDRIIALAIQGEDAPQLSNRVDLDPAVRDLDGMPVPRVTYQNHAFELSARQFYAPLLIKALGAAGAKFAAIGPADMIPASDHIMGTLRMGTDATSSVCDATGRFHDVGNLYTSDGSLFPTASGFNPTMTIIALACYVAGGMVFPGSPEKAIA